MSIASLREIARVCKCVRDSATCMHVQGRREGDAEGAHGQGRVLEIAPRLAKGLNRQLWPLPTGSAAATPHKIQSSTRPHHPTHPGSACSSIFMPSAAMAPAAPPPSTFTATPLPAATSLPCRSPEAASALGSAAASQGGRPWMPGPGKLRGTRACAHAHRISCSAPHAHTGHNGVPHTHTRDITQCPIYPTCTHDISRSAPHAPHAHGISRSAPHTPHEHTIYHAVPHMPHMHTGYHAVPHMPHMHTRYITQCPSPRLGCQAQGSCGADAHVYRHKPRTRTITRMHEQAQGGACLLAQGSCRASHRHVHAQMHAQVHARGAIMHNEAAGRVSSFSHTHTHAHTHTCAHTHTHAHTHVRTTIHSHMQATARALFPAVRRRMHAGSCTRRSLRE